MGGCWWCQTRCITDRGLSLEHHRLANACHLFFLNGRRISEVLHSHQAIYSLAATITSISSYNTIMRRVPKSVLVPNPCPNPIALNLPIQQVHFHSVRSMNQVQADMWPRLVYYSCIAYNITTCLQAGDAPIFIVR